eukprot:COSAG02_NODE_3920_length_6045_cov_4.403128_3_plen_211_part_00
MHCGVTPSAETTGSGRINAKLLSLPLSWLLATMPVVSQGSSFLSPSPGCWSRWPQCPRDGASSNSLGHLQALQIDPCSAPPQPVPLRPNLVPPTSAALSTPHSIVWGRNSATSLQHRAATPLFPRATVSISGRPPLATTLYYGGRRWCQQPAVRGRNWGDHSATAMGSKLGRPLTQIKQQSQFTANELVQKINTDEPGNSVGICPRRESI